MVDKRQIIHQLPSVLQTNTLQKFFGATVDHLFQPQSSEVISGYIGQRTTYTNTEKDFYISEPTKSRQDYSLEPLAISTSTTNETTNALFYDDLLNHIRFNGGFVNNHSRLFDNEFYSWCPPIDVDKVINYKRYYWMPYGPDAITLRGISDVERTIIGKSSYPISVAAEYHLPEDKDDSPIRTGEITLTCGMRLTITNDINTKYNGKTYIVEGVGSSILLVEEPAAVGGLRWDDIGNNNQVPYVLFIDDHTVDIQDLIGEINTCTSYSFTGWYKKASDQCPWRSFDPANPPEMNDITDTRWEATYAPADSPLVFEENMQIIFVTYGYEQVSKYTYHTRMYQVTGVGSSIQMIRQDYGWGVGGFGGATASFSMLPDYMVIERGSFDGNPWSRNNRWFHEDLVKHENRGTDLAIRASRPIMEYRRNLELFNYGTQRTASVDIKEDLLTFSQINGFIASNPDFMRSQAALREFGVAPLLLDTTRSKRWVDLRNDPSCTWKNFDGIDEGGRPFILLTSASGDVLSSDEARRAIFYINGNPLRIGYDYKVSGNYVTFMNPPYASTNIAAVYWDTEKGVLIRDGMTILITNDPNPDYNNKVYVVSGIKSTGRVILNLVDRVLVYGDIIRATSGFGNLDRDFRFVTTSWEETQRKSTINQPPLFNLYDIDGVLLSDPGRYPNSTFVGNKLYGYAITTSAAIDDVLGLHIKHNDSGEIMYTNYLYTDRCVYDGGEITGYYFHKTVGTNPIYSNDWYVVDTPSLQRIKHTYIATDGQRVFDTSYVFRDGEQKSVSIIVGSNKITSGYTIVGSTVVFDAPLTKGDLVIIYTSLRRNPDKLCGVYEIPTNLQANPDWREVTDVANSDYFDHFVSILTGQDGFNGFAFGANNFRDTPKDYTLGRVILQHRAPMLKSMILASDQNIDFMQSVQYVEHEYVRFRNKFLRKCQDLYHSMDVPVTPDVFVDRALEEINLGKTSDFAFAYSSMVPTGEKVFSFRFNGASGVHSYVVPVSPEKLSSSLVYRISEDGNRVLMSYLWDYRVSGDEITINQSLTEADVIELVIYGIDSAYVPATPAHLGIGPMYYPQIFVDDTLVTPRSFIQCHDGAIIDAFGKDDDYLNMVLLELERRIYNSSLRKISDRNGTSAFDHKRYVSGKFRRSVDEVLTDKHSLYQVDYTRSEWVSIIKANFERWATLSKINYRENLTYISDNPFTWNYAGIQDRDGDILPGHWRGIYQYYFDTDRPHTHPWEMIGLSQKPDWWDGVYGVGPYTRGNTKLWHDMANGFVADGITGTLPHFIRPNLLDYLPVDDFGNLIDPISAGICPRKPTAFEAQRGWEFGDHGPVETAWRRSHNYAFAVVQAGYLIKPVRMIEYCWDVGRTILVYPGQKASQQWVISDIRARRPHSYLTVHGEAVEAVPAPDKYRVYGVQQWISDYISSRGQNPSTVLGDVIRGIGVRLGHKCAGFINQNTLQVRADNFGLVPQENVTVFLYRSPSIADYTYSGVVVEWTGRSWKVYGYDVIEPHFNTIPSDVNGPRTKVHVGRDAPLSRPWKSGVVYDTGSVVTYEGTEYKCLTMHTSTGEFHGNNWKPLDIGPNNRGIGVTYYLSGNKAGNIKAVPYGTEFYTPQDVFDFLCEYGRWLTSMGWVFDQTNVDNTEPVDWLSSAKDYLFWTLGKWASGTSIVLSPGATNLKFKCDHGEVQNIERIVRGAYSMLNRDGYMIPPTSTVVMRVGNEVQITPKSDQSIYLARLFVSEIEHVVVFDNTTVFADLIYDPVFNLRQPRLRLTTNRSMNWSGRIDAPGFVVTDNLMYANFEKSADDFRRFYGIESGVDNPVLRNYAMHIIGYQNRNYLDSLVLDAKTQIEFYQGMIRQKGTHASMQRLLRSMYVIDAEDVKFYDEWAFRVGNYGATATRNVFEFMLAQHEIKANPQMIVFDAANTQVGDFPNDDVINIPQTLSTWATGIAYSKYQQVQYNNRYYEVVVAHTSGVLDDDIAEGRMVEVSSRWMVRPSSETIFPMLQIGATGAVPTAGYARVDEATVFAFDMIDLQTVHDELLDKNTNFKITDRVLVYDFKNDWMMFKLTHPTVMTLIEPNRTGGTKIVTASPHGYCAGDIIVVMTETRAIPEVRGVRVVSSVIDETTFIIDMTTSEMFDWTAQGETGPTIYKFSPCRFKTVGELRTTDYWSNGDVAYVDGTSGYEVYVYGNGWTILRREPKKVDSVKLRDAVIYNKSTNRTNQRLHLFDPVKGIIPNIADAEIYYKMETDPAVYSSGDPMYNRIDKDHAWGSAQVNRLWWDLSTVRYLDCEISDLTYRRNIWGRIAPRASIDVYEWTRSTVPPTSWDSMAAKNSNAISKDAPSGTVRNGENPAWCERVEYDPSSGLYSTVYYFWVKNKLTVPSVDWRKWSANQIARMLVNPTEFGMAWYAPISDNAMIISGVDGAIDDTDSVVQITSVMNPDQTEIHRQWVIMRDGDASSIPDDALWYKMRDSLVGFDQNEYDVPDPKLSEIERFGTLVRPRQTWFDDIALARRVFVNRLNSIFASRPVVFENDVSFLNNANEYAKTFKTANMAVKNHAATITVDLATTLADLDISLTDGEFAGTIDSTFVTDGAIVLVKNQTNAIENGIYKYNRHTHTFIRQQGIVDGQLVYVARGNANRASEWIAEGTHWVQPINDNEYHFEVSSIDERNSLEVDDSIGLIKGHQVLVTGNVSTCGAWSIWKYVGNEVASRWVLVKSQKIGMKDFWALTDWYSTGYDQYSVPQYKFKTESERDAANVAVNGVLVRIGSETEWYWTCYNGKRWDIVARSGGTVVFNEKLYIGGHVIKVSENNTFEQWANRDGSLELKQIIDGISVVLTGHERNQLFFAMVYHVLSEQRVVDWVMKTSFLYVNGINEPLTQEAILRKDNTNAILGYLEEIKPYHTKIRDFTLSHVAPIEVATTRMTDFDKPIIDGKAVGVIWNGNTYEVETPYDDTTFTSSRDHVDWFRNFKDIGPSYNVRNMRISMYFDRIKWVDWYIDGEKDIMSLFTDKNIQVGDRVWFHNYDHLNQDHWKLMVLRSPNHPLPVYIKSISPSTNGRMIVETTSSHSLVGSNYNLLSKQYEVDVAYVVGNIVRFNETNYVCVSDYTSRGDFESELENWSSNIPQYPVYCVIPSTFPEVVAVGDGVTRIYAVPFRVNPDDLEIVVGGIVQTSESSEIGGTYAPQYEIVQSELTEKFTKSSIKLKHKPYHMFAVKVSVKRNVSRAIEWNADSVYDQNAVVMHDGTHYVSLISNNRSMVTTTNWAKVDADLIRIRPPYTADVASCDPLYSYTISDDLITLTHALNKGDQIIVSYKIDPGVSIRLATPPEEGQSVYIRRKSMDIGRGSYKVVRYIDDTHVEVVGSKTVTSKMTLHADNLIKIYCYDEDYLTVNGEVVLYNHEIDETLLTEAERIQLYYRPTDGMPERNVRDLLQLDYKGTIIDGGRFVDSFGITAGSKTPVANEVYHDQEAIIIPFWEYGWDTAIGWGEQAWGSGSVPDLSDSLVVQFNGITQDTTNYEIVFDNDAKLWKIKFIVAPINGDLVTVYLIPNSVVTADESDTTNVSATKYYDMNLVGGSFSAPAPTIGDARITDGSFTLPGPVQSFIASRDQSDFRLDDNPVIGVISTDNELDWHVRVYRNSIRIKSGYKLRYSDGDSSWHVLMDVPCDEGDEIRTELMGRAVVSDPRTGQNRPQELIPCRVTDSLGISVYTEPTSGAPTVLTARHVADGVRNTFGIQQRPSNRSAVFVAVGSGDDVMMLTNVPIRELLSSDTFYVEWDTAQVELGFVPESGTLVKVMSFSVGGTVHSNIDTFVCVGKSSFTLSKTPSASHPNMRVWTQYDGVVAEVTDMVIIDGEVITLQVLPVDGAVIIVSYDIVVEDAGNAFQNTQSQRIVEIKKSTTGSIILDNPENISYTTNHITVIVNGDITTAYALNYLSGGRYEVRLRDGSTREMVVVAANTPNLTTVHTENYAWDGAPIRLDIGTASFPPHGSVVVNRVITDRDLTSEDGLPLGTARGMPIQSSDVGRSIRLTPPTTRYFYADGNTHVFRFDRAITEPEKTKIWVSGGSIPLTNGNGYAIPVRFNGAINVYAPLPNEETMNILPGDFFVISDSTDGFDNREGFDSTGFDSHITNASVNPNWCGSAFAGTWAIKGQPIPNPNQANQDSFDFEQGDMVMYLGNNKWSRLSACAGQSSNPNYGTYLDAAIKEAMREIHLASTPTADAEICMVWYEDGYEYDVVDGALVLTNAINGTEVAVTTFTNDMSFGIRTEVFTGRENGEYPVSRIPWNSNSMWVSVNGRQMTYGTDYNIHNGQYGWDEFAWDSSTGWDSSKSRPMINFFNTHRDDWTVVITTFNERQAKPSVAFKLFKNLDDEWENIRITDANSTRLSAALKITDVSMSVDDASVFAGNTPTMIISRNDRVMTADTASFMLDIISGAGIVSTHRVVISSNANGEITHLEIATAVNKQMKRHGVTAAILDGVLSIRKQGEYDLRISGIADDIIVEMFFGKNIVHSIRYLDSPEVVYVNDERIEYSALDTVDNKLLLIRRGTGGTSKGIPAVYSKHRAISTASAKFTMPEDFVSLSGAVVATFNGVTVPCIMHNREVSLTVVPPSGTVVLFEALASDWTTTNVSYTAGTVVLDGGSRQVIPGGYRWEGLIDRGFRGVVDAIPDTNGRWYKLSRSYDTDLLDIRVVVLHQGLSETVTELLTRYVDWYVDGNILKFTRDLPLSDDGHNNIIIQRRDYKGIQNSNTALAQFLLESPYHR